MAGSFEKDIKPLFKQPAVNHMKRLNVLLHDYSWMSDPAGDATYPDHANAHGVYFALSPEAIKRMPPGGPYFTEAQMKTLSDWMSVDPKFEP